MSSGVARETLDLEEYAERLVHRMTDRRTRKSEKPARQESRPPAANEKALETVG